MVNPPKPSTPSINITKDSLRSNARTNQPSPSTLGEPSTSAAHTGTPDQLDPSPTPASEDGSEVAALRAQLAQMKDELDRLRLRTEQQHLPRLSEPLPSIERHATFDYALYNDEPAPQQTLPRQASYTSAESTRSTKVEKIPNLTAKLSDGVSYRPLLWKRQLIQHLHWYSAFFFDDDHRKTYIVNQTEGRARDFLEPLFLDEDSTETPMDLIEAVVRFLQNPAEQQQAADAYQHLYMKPAMTFWEFYQQFRILATTAGIRDDNTLRTNLRDKILPRLRAAVVHEWKRCSNVNEYASVIQDEDADYIARSSRNPTTTSRPSSSNRGTSYSSSRSAQQTIAAQSSQSLPILQRPAQPQQPSLSSPAPPANTPRHFSGPPRAYSTPQPLRTNTPSYKPSPDATSHLGRINEIVAEEDINLEYNVEDSSEDAPLSYNADLQDSDNRSKEQA